jgi:hypothetical protein
LTPATVGEFGVAAREAELIRAAVRKRSAEFRISDIEHTCPGVGREWIRTVLAEMKKDGEIECKGRGFSRSMVFMS